MDKHGEVWEEIPGFLGRYKVSNYARVKNPEKIIKQRVDKCGYLTVLLNNRQHKRKQQFKVHRLVAVAFIPNPEQKPTVNHINGIKTDNSINNLEWATNTEQTSHARMNGLLLVGDRVGSSKLTTEQVISIKKSNKRATELSIIYGVSKECISKMQRGLSWVHLNSHIPENRIGRNKICKNKRYVLLKEKREAEKRYQVLH